MGGILCAAGAKKNLHPLGSPLAFDGVRAGTYARIVHSIDYVGDAERRRTGAPEGYKHANLYPGGEEMKKSETVATSSDRFDLCVLTVIEN